MKNKHKPTLHSLPPLMCFLIPQIRLGASAWAQNGVRPGNRSDERYSQSRKPLGQFRLHRQYVILQIERLWQHCVEPSLSAPFSNSICSRTSLCHILVVLAIFQTLTIFVFVVAICDQRLQLWNCDSLEAQMMVSGFQQECIFKLRYLRFFFFFLDIIL